LPSQKRALRAFVEGEDVGHDTVEEEAVVGDHDTAAGEGLERLLEDLERAEVHVVSLGERDRGALRVDLNERQSGLPQATRSPRFAERSA
jgi:hypothetical protein